MSSDANQFGVILEDIDSKFDRLIEAVSQLQDEMKTKADKSDIERIERKIDTIKVVVKDQSHELKDHALRITKLETA